IAMGEYDGPREVSGSAIILAFLSGAAVGAIAALLMAPQSGRESREQLKGYARRAGGNFREATDKAGETWQTAMEKGGEVVREQKSILKEALDAGREAMRRPREQPEEKNT
ncbi:MAG: YtxH domain-containing protein, partial [Nitrospirota bacterium]|nr:YtxH domain-containing protein [Nitrospirota bacterium]